MKWGAELVITCCAVMSAFHSYQIKEEGSSVQSESDACRREFRRSQFKTVTSLCHELNSPARARFLVTEGTRYGLAACRASLAHQRWQCDAGAPVNRSLHGLPVLGTGWAERGLVEAFFGAGATMALEQACMRGAFSDNCGCTEADLVASRKPTVGDCSDNNQVKILHVLREYVRQRGDSRVQRLVSRQNVWVGTNLAKQSRHGKHKCACVGLSHSCIPSKVCYKQVPSFQPSIARRILNRFEKREQVASTTVTPSTECLGRLVNQESGQCVKKMNLLYINPSPDFCSPIPDLYYPGVKGRLCHSQDEPRCEKLCCNSSEAQQMALPSISKCSYDYSTNQVVCEETSVQVPDAFHCT